ncbi:hydroxymethylbilane synthase [Paenibacillus sp. MBLB2552]|uniref:Porphobilinogen deaminase n=1 Tax=Paenibacillus mellifer TaxID=2937794 RepID=A0A9X2BRF9_9BACL|nr:hydroxymethylbilane synthase [Paenibacillus mellifer]MCK8488867.1 hydroxymethylbilane synthase [Paenibacillus mellifer]
MTKRTIVVGTRQSQLALTQTGHVIDDLKALCREHHLQFDFEIRKIVTKGDRILDVTLSKVGGKGLFVKEIEQAMLDKEIDLAVHSMKDMPSVLPDGLINGAVPRRVDPRDALISRNNLSLDELPQGAKVGTSSLRRASQLKAYRPDLVLEPIRGNIDSRLRKLEEEGFDAIILAAAGLLRMGWEHRITAYLPAEVCLPAVGQGALGIECREDDAEVRHLLSLYNDSETAVTVAAERRFLGVLNGGCQVPIGAYATLLPDEGASDSSGRQRLQLTGMVGSADGAKILKESAEGVDPTELGEQVAGRLISLGAAALLQETGE